MARISNNQKISNYKAFLDEQGYQTIKKDDYRCIKCNEYKNSKNFYKAYDENMYGSGLMPICKECSEKILDNYFAVFNNFEKALLYTCEDLNFVYYEPAVEALKTRMANAIKEDKSLNNLFGNYKAALAQNKKNIKGFKFRDSDIKKDDSEDTKKKIEHMLVSVGGLDDKEDDFSIAKLEKKYGYGYKEEEYLNFERKYKKMEQGYTQKTALHTERFLDYIIKKVKEEMAMAKGDITEATKYEVMAKNAATAAKINVSQLSKSDITGGVDLLPQLTEALEEKVSLIPIMPKLKVVPYDDADMIIYALTNYNRRLEGKDIISYSDVWSFYDEMFYNHFKEIGYSDEQIQLEKNKRNNIFRDLGEIYYEPLYSSHHSEHDLDILDDIIEEE